MPNLTGTNMQQVTVTGTYIGHDGELLDGWVSFTASTIVNDSGAQRTLMPVPIRLSLVDGAFSTQLLATDDPDGNPVGWRYLVEQFIDGQELTPFYVELPGAGGAYDMANLTPVDLGDGPIYVPPGGGHDHFAEHYTKVQADSRFVNIDGDVLTDYLELHANPVSPLQAAPKQYVDGFLPLDGGSLTDFLTLHANPTNNLHAATKQYVDSAAAGAAGALAGHVSDPDPHPQYAPNSAGVYLRQYRGALTFNSSGAAAWAHGQANAPSAFVAGFVAGSYPLIITCGSSDSTYINVKAWKFGASGISGPGWIDFVGSATIHIIAAFPITRPS